ncbi:MAG: acyl-protein synthetase [Herpetosiphonaceae bacterium]|nr:MAG: acyl-protein synthetase [Herpetosiphonaceae bacterium]
MAIPHIPAELEQKIRSLIAGGVEVDAPRDDEQFNALALEIFTFQFETNETYRQFCLARGRTPQTVAQWEEIPALPAPLAGELVPHNPLYEAAVLPILDTYLFPDDARMTILGLADSAGSDSSSQLTALISLALASYGTETSGSFVRAGALDAAGLAAALRNAEERGDPICLIGDTHYYTMFMDYCADQGLRFHLPRGSRLLDTVQPDESGKQPPRDKIYKRYRETLGLTMTACINLYTPAGLASPFIDSMLYDAHRRDWRPRHKVIPPWVRSQIVDATTLDPVRRGSVGLLRHVDLANLYSVLAVQTRDLGVVVAYGFEVIGQASAEID